MTNCKWHSEESDEYTGVYNTDCGESFICSDGCEIVTDWANYCFFCGGKIELTPLEDE